MTDENVAWEQFQKADATNLEQASAAGMLQAIMAELSSVKADTARLAQKLPDAGADAGADELAQEDAEVGGGMMPPMDGGAPPIDEGGTPSPMGDLGAQPMEGDESFSDEDLEEGEGMGGLGDMSDEDKANLSAMFSQDLVPDPMEMDQGAAGGEVEQDETLDALQDALTRVKDPEAIAKLADIIKEYVMSNAGELEAEAHPEAAAGAGDMPPEALLAALAGGEDPAINGAGEMVPTMLAGVPEEGAQSLSAEPGVEDLSPELLEGLMKSDDDAKKVEEERDVVTTDGKTDATPGTTDIAASDTDDDECGNDGAPCVTITITVGELLESPMSKLFDTNQEDGTTPKDLDKDKKFESFEAACKTEPVKRSIDDLMNQSLRGRRGANGEFYKISKSATEIANERTLSVRKSLSSLNSVADMRVGDVLKSMWGLRQMGVGNLEKTYEPLIDEVVKYCDNHVGPQYTEPLFRSFGVDLSKIYDPLPTSTFVKAMGRLGIGDPSKVTRFDTHLPDVTSLLLASQILGGESETRLVNSKNKLGSADTETAYGTKGNTSFERNGYRLRDLVKYLASQGKNAFSLSELNTLDNTLAPFALNRILENAGVSNMWANPEWNSMYQNRLSRAIPGTTSAKSLSRMFNNELNAIQKRIEGLEEAQKRNQGKAVNNMLFNGKDAKGALNADPSVTIKNLNELKDAIQKAAKYIDTHFAKDSKFDTGLSLSKIYEDLLKDEDVNEWVIPGHEKDKMAYNSQKDFDSSLTNLYEYLYGSETPVSADDVLTMLQRDYFDVANYASPNSPDGDMINIAKRYQEAQQYAKDNPYMNLGSGSGIDGLGDFVYDGTVDSLKSNPQKLLNQIAATLDVESARDYSAWANRTNNNNKEKIDLTDVKKKNEQTLGETPKTGKLEGEPRDDDPTPNKRVDINKLNLGI